MLVIIFFTSIFCSWILSNSMIPFLRDYLLDKPNDRSSHINPTPSGGGLIIVIIGILSSLLLKKYLILLCLPIALVGIIDDKFKLPSLLRYLIQILTVFFIMISVDFTLLDNYPLKNLCFLIFLILGTAIINFINFMDGIDGITAGCMILILGSFAFTTDPFLVGLVGSLIGFLILNWHPAKLFMGDIGSTFLGATFLIPLFSSETTYNFIDSFLITLPLSGDAIICVLRRLFNKEPIFSAHKKHLYQRLHQAGLSHSQVSLVYIFCTFILVLSKNFYSPIYLYITSTLILFVGFVLDRKVASNFN